MPEGVPAVLLQIIVTPIASCFSENSSCLDFKPKTTYNKIELL